MQHPLGAVGLGDHLAPEIDHQRTALAEIPIRRQQPGTETGQQDALGIEDPGPHQQVPLTRAGGGVEGGGTSQQPAAVALLRQQRQLREAVLQQISSSRLGGSAKPVANGSAQRGQGPKRGRLERVPAWPDRLDLDQGQG